MRLLIKPLSVNDAWQGKRFKTDKYKAFEKHMMLLLPKINIELEGELKVDLKYGFSSKLSDIDNPTKPLLDCLQKKYGFDDRQIFELNTTKEIVPKGEEYIDFTITARSKVLNKV